MPGFGDSAFIILLALLLFGPKKLPVLARQLGKLMADFRRASNEFRSQMEEELRVSEQAERQKQIAALEASAPATAVEVPATDQTAETPDFASFGFPDMSTSGTPAEPVSESENSPENSIPVVPEHSIAPPAATEPVAPQPLPVATSGDLAMMPPATGLPVPSTSPPHGPRSAAEPQTQPEQTAEPVAEIAHHG
jgi:sec-independent protein translocase protein TatB